jgi:hypothetical protein
MKYIVRPERTTTKRSMTMCALCSEDPRFCDGPPWIL